MKFSPLAAWRAGVLALGLLAAVLLVRTLDEGLAGEPRPLSGDHLAFGALVALTVMPGPLLAFFATPRSGDRLRGLAVGGAGMTAFAAVVGGAFLAPRVFGEGRSGPADWVAFGWCALALPLSAVDFLRLRQGDPRPS